MRKASLRLLGHDGIMADARCTAALTDARAGLAPKAVAAAPVWHALAASALLAGSSLLLASAVILGPGFEIHDTDRAADPALRR